MMDPSDLDRELLKAHAREDLPILIRLYTCAADQHSIGSEGEAFYLTHAFVFALEAGAPEAEALNKRLADLGRTHLLAF